MERWKLSRRLSLTAVCVAAAALLSLWAALGVPAASAAKPSAAKSSAAKPTAVRPHGLPRAKGHRLSELVVILRDGMAERSGRRAARASAIRSEETPLINMLRARGGREIKAGTSIPYLLVRASAGQRTALARYSDVKLVVPNQRFQLTPTASATPAPAALSKPKTGTRKAHTAAPTSSTTSTSSTSAAACGTASNPEHDPEADGLIDSTQANALGFDGAGVKTAYMAGEIDTTIPDYQRNPAYASSGSPAGSPVVIDENFTGDPANAVDVSGAAGESFLDASSIAAQGDQTFNLADYVNQAYPLPATCDITITGVAPGATVYGLDVFANDYFTTTSDFIQAIDWAVDNGVQVLNQSFGSNGFPENAEDAVYDADNDAIADGVTITVSSGDAGVADTLGSPATDPNVISAGATTSLRTFEQTGYAASKLTGINNSGTYLDNNIADFSSSGFAEEGGNTVNLVAPGDANWIDCSTNPIYAGDCENRQTTPGASPIDLEGGTSESAPLTAGAAADVIQAYAESHNGADPSPALIKQILLSTATDVDAPAEQQGAGLLDVLAAVKEAEAISRPSTETAHGGSELISPNQVNIVQNPGQSTSRQISISNSSASPETVDLSTRAFTQSLASQSGSLCLNPSAATISCGAPTTATFSSIGGLNDVYATRTFTVPADSVPTRLELSATYAVVSGQTEPLGIALFDPSGAYALYSRPQGVSGYADMQVSDPKPGTWTAVFFTEQDGASPGAVGTTGTVQWTATTSAAQSAGQITPATLTIAPGQSASATFTATSPRTSGDAAQSIVASTVGGSTTTIPVTVRTLVPVGFGGGSFSGVLTGGNGRMQNAQANYYEFNVPGGQRNIAVSVGFNDANDGVVAYLEDPEGNVVAASSNITLDQSGSDVIGTQGVSVYEADPQPGTYHLLLDWLSPDSGAELSEPFTGRIRFNTISALPFLPAGRVQLEQGKSYTFDIAVKNTAQTPEAYFLDPRTNQLTTYTLPDLDGADGAYTLPLTGYPIYSVPTHTTSLQTTVTSSGPVTFDEDPLAGDPDVSPAVGAAGASASQSGDTASLTYSPGGEVGTGLWAVFPSEIGPYGAAGAPAETSDTTFSLTTLGFDPSVTTSTGDLWSADDGLTSTFTPDYLQPGQTAILALTITPTAAPGTRVNGEINLDDTFQEDEAIGASDDSGDELDSFPYSYTVSAPPHPGHHQGHHR
jgi:hypothetical protein